MSPATLLLLLFAADTTGPGAGAPDTAVAPPPGRYFASAVHDTRRDRVILFGGTDGARPLGEVWVRPLADSGAGWTRLSVAGEGPSARLRHAAIYDPECDRMLVYGGYDAQAGLADLWSLSLADTARWERLQPAGGGPGPRVSASLLLDRRHDRILLVGGGPDDVWALSLTGPPRWSRHPLRGRGPGARYGQTAVLDSARNRVLLFGGYGGNYSFLMAAMGGPPTRTHDDLWEFGLGEGAQWSVVLPARRIAPAHRGDHAAALDPARDRMLVFGGTTRYSGERRDLWAFEMDGPPRWERADVAPFGRAGSGARLIADPARDRLLAIGTGREGAEVLETAPLSGMRFVTPPPAVSPLAATLVAEGFFGAISAIGYAKDGAGTLSTINRLCAVTQLGTAVLSPDPERTLAAQVAAGVAWLGLSFFQDGQRARRAPASQVALGNMIGYQALLLVDLGVERLARRHARPARERR